MPSERHGKVSVSRREALVGAAGIIIAGVAAPSGAAAAAPRGGQLGARGGANGLEFLGEISQEADALTGYGYFTGVSGLAADQLFFASGEHSETTARFTFHATARLVGIQRRDDVFVAHAEGLLAIDLRDTPGATFDNPSTFAEGQRIASDEATLEDVTSVIAPNTGVVTVFGDLRRTAVSRFTLDGAAYQLGRIALRSRLAASGRGRRLDPAGPKAILTVGGNTTNPAESGDER